MNSLRDLRQKRKLTQQDLADKLGVSRVAVTKWETGEAYPRAELLPKIAEVLRCKIDTLFLVKSVN